MRTLTSLIGRTVVTQTGTDLGRCHDIKADLQDDRLEVIALCVGRQGYLARLGIRTRHHEEIEWSSIVRIDGNQITVASSEPTRTASN